LRPGEKLTEELFLEDEKPIPTPHTKLLLARSVSQDVDAIRARISGFAEAVGEFDEKSS